MSTSSSSEDDDDNHHRPQPVKIVRFADDIQHDQENHQVEGGVGESMVMSDYSMYWFMPALGVMMEDGINRIGCVTVQLTNDGLLFTARNPRTGAPATLVYQSEFRTFFYKPPPLLPPRIIYLSPVVNFLFDFAPVDGPVSVCYAPRLLPAHLLFLLRIPPRGVTKQYEAEFIDDNYKFTRSPIFCEFPITTAVLQEMMEHFFLLPYKGDQLVSADAKSEAVKISIKLPNQKASGSWEIRKSRSSPGMKYHALFKLPHLIFVSKPIKTSVDANLTLTEPEKHIILQYILKEFGELVLSFKPIELNKVPDDDPPGGNFAEALQSSGDSAEASRSSSPAAEASHTDDDAAEASQSGGDTAEVSQSGGNTAEASQSGGDTADALQPGIDASKASENGVYAAEGSLSDGDAVKGIPPRDVAELFEADYKFTRNPIFCEIPITTAVLQERLDSEAVEAAHPGICTTTYANDVAASLMSVDVGLDITTQDLLLMAKKFLEELEHENRVCHIYYDDEGRLVRAGQVDLDLCRSWAEFAVEVRQLVHINVEPLEAEDQPVTPTNCWPGRIANYFAHDGGVVSPATPWAEAKIRLSRGEFLR